MYGCNSSLTQKFYFLAEKVHIKVPHKALDNIIDTTKCTFSKVRTVFNRNIQNIVTEWFEINNFQLVATKLFVQKGML